MGSYLTKPLTDKESKDESNDRLSYGASTMQGWRVTQEDAHNHILDFDVNTSFFAVYDGHGGHEVAQYCSEKLPQFIKDTQAYKDGDIEQALVRGFLEFDATIATPEVVDILKEIAREKVAEEESDEEENVDNLYAEATMPIEQVMKKYATLVNPVLNNVKKDGDKIPKSPYLKGKQEGAAACSAGSSESAACSSSGEATSADGPSQPGNSEAVTSSSTECSEAKSSSDAKETVSIPEKNGSIPEIKVSSSDSLESNEATSSSLSSTQAAQNGDVSDNVTKTDVSSSTAQENGDVSSKGKGKAIKPKTPKKPLVTRPTRNAKQLYKKLLDFKPEEESESEDEDDTTFDGPNEDSSDDEEGVNVTLEGDDSEEDDTSGEEEESEEEDGEDDSKYDDAVKNAENAEDKANLEFARNMKEEPGSDSGCTAVVALLKGNELYVANAGDSRCIVCRSGKAIDMSFDHKPEDEPEHERILKAGGNVSRDGRVNGGLNLSRAIGDHGYKQNKNLSDKEQMITALPDIKTLTINPAEDEFLVLACDGIWNFMSSQEVVDFIRPRIWENKVNLSTICEEMFDHCLAPDSIGDGTGCDNMTAIIVRFKTNILKRSASPVPNKSDIVKKIKTDETIKSETGTTKSEDPVTSQPGAATNEDAAKTAEKTEGDSLKMESEASA